MTFFFSKSARAAPDQGYAAFIFPTNLANWGSNEMVGNVTGLNRGAADLSIYFTRTNPLPELSTDETGYVQLSAAQRSALAARLEEMKIVEIPGSEALLGQMIDLVPFEDLNWCSIVTKGVDTDIDVYVQLVEQRLPKVIT